MSPEQPPVAPDNDPEDADPGLARQRTDLAWTRSAIAFAALGVAIVKLRPALGVPVLAFSALIWTLGHLPKSAQARWTGRRVPVVTVAVTTLAVIALVVALVNHGTAGLRPLGTAQNDGGVMADIATT